MKNYSAKEIKNIVLIGAPGSGKTTLAEAMAYEGKVIDRRGAVETNNTLSDNTDIEHEYKRSIYSTILFTEFMERKLNIIDCPGSDDFCGSLFSAFKVGDVSSTPRTAGKSVRRFRRAIRANCRNRSSASSTSSTPRRPTSRGRSRASAPHRA